ncbi:MAG TPA: EAL domain-containing protein [Terriglobales bacterium]|nr:EAL domain-containing protein [Terriglobales bacterium]
MIVDDTGALAELVAALRQSGDDVVLFQSADELITDLEQTGLDPTLVLINATGAVAADNLLVRLRSDEHAANLSIMVALATDAAMVAALSHGANDCLAVPLNLKLALARLRQQIRLHHSAQEARQQRERFDLVVVGAGDGIWDWQIDNDSLYFSPRLLQMLGCNHDDRPSSVDDWIDLVHADDINTVRRELRNHLEGISLQFRVECRMQHRNHSYRWFLIRGASLHDQFGKVTRVAGSLIDISERKMTDPMTGLPNRLVLYDRVNQAIQRCRRRRAESFGIILLQSDRYEAMRAAYGQAFCDQSQRLMADRIAKSLRATDTLTVINENTLCVMVDVMRDDVDLLRVARRLRSAAEEPMLVGEENVVATLSVGMAEGTPDHRDAEELLKHATAALNKARLQGSGQEAVFDPDSQDRSRERLRLEADLHLALRRNELYLHYQPIVDLAHDRVAGFEALLRWEHPTRGRVPPNEFIPIAEQTGLIVAIGSWVLQEAIQQVRRWIDDGVSPDIFVSVNVSSRQLDDPDLLPVTVQQLVLEQNLQPGNLRLELTESAIMQDIAASREMLRRLREIGCRVLLDDFGTGYSSLSLLQGLPIDVLKIDQAFIKSMRSDRSGVRMVEAIVQLARLFDLKVVAEGIEDGNDDELCRACGCDYGQGWHFGKPKLAADCAPLLPRPVVVLSN